MNIIDCEKQLHKLLKLYDHIYHYNNKITDILIRRGEQITFKEVYQIFDYIYEMHKSMPVDFNKYLKYFDNVDISWIYKLKDDLVLLFNKTNGRIYIQAGIETFIKKLDPIQFQTSIESIYYILNNLRDGDDIRCSLIIDDNLHREFIDQLFEACLKYRNAAIDYMNSLELPTMSDWDEANKNIQW